MVPTVVDGDYNLTTLDNVVVFTTAGTANLPLSIGLGQTYRICNESNGDVTIDGYGTDTIGGELTKTVLPGESLIVTDYTTGKWC